MRKLTTRTVQPGGVFYNERIGHLVRVPTTHCSLYCEYCHWSTAIPTRLGLDHIESIRKQHLERAHLEDILKGKLQITEEDLTFDPAGLGV